MSSLSFYLALPPQCTVLVNIRTFARRPCTSSLCILVTLSSLYLSCPPYHGVCYLPAPSPHPFPSYYASGLLSSLPLRRRPTVEFYIKLSSAATIITRIYTSEPKHAGMATENTIARPLTNLLLSTGFQRYASSNQLLIIVVQGRFGW
jgi:hypothetical protein